MTDATPIPSGATPDARSGATSQVTAQGAVRLSHLVALFAIVVVAIAWIGVWTALQTKRADAIDAEIRQNQNLARALQEQTLRVLASADQATLRMRDAIAAGGMRPEMFVRIANETGMAPDILTQLAFVGPDGRLKNSNLDPTGERTEHVDLSEREHIRAHLHVASIKSAVEQFSRSGLFIGKPVLGKVSGKWTIQLSRRITGRNGELLGVVVASLNPGYLEDVYGRVLLGEQGTVALVGDDLTVRARVLGGEARGMGSMLPAAPGGMPESGATEGHSIRSSRVDGIERIIAFHRVGDYPLTLIVGSTTELALRDWRDTRRVALILTTLFSLATLGGAWVFVSSVRRLEDKNRALAISEARAQSANQAKSEFLAAISHELRTPLTSIRGFAELMGHRLEDQRLRDQAGMIRKAAEHLNALLTEILDFSKVEAGELSLNPESQVLADLVRGTADFFAVTAASKGLRMVVEIDPSAPATLVCDGFRLKQILNNLLSNAVKFTSEGQITLALDATSEWVRIHVIDTGPGIAPDLHELIFERFRQANSRISYEHGGTGLGLALARGLAERMGGTLRVISALGQGARFTLSLPLRPVQSDKPSSS